jgi:hypothetical protein
MTAPPITPDAQRSNAARARHRRTRDTAVVASVALLIAAGGYAAANTFGPGPRSPESRAASPDYVRPSDTVMRELRKSVIGQYGARPSPPTRVARQHAQAAGPYVRPSEKMMRDLHESIAGQYGSAR